jgi:hypothetical protein
MFRKHVALMAVSLILLALAPSGLTQNAGEDGKKNETSAEKSGLPLEQMVKTITEQPMLSSALLLKTLIAIRARNRPWFPQPLGRQSAL